MNKSGEHGAVSSNANFYAMQIAAVAVRRYRYLHVPGYTSEPEPKPVCRRFDRCEGCPYPAIGFLCWSEDGECMRTRVSKLNGGQMK